MTFLVLTFGKFCQLLLSRHLKFVKILKPTKYQENFNWNTKNQIGFGFLSDNQNFGFRLTSLLWTIVHLFGITHYRRSAWVIYSTKGIQFRRRWRPCQSRMPSVNCMTLIKLWCIWSHKRTIVDNDCPDSKPMRVQKKWIAICRNQMKKCRFGVQKVYWAYAQTYRERRLGAPCIASIYTEYRVHRDRKQCG